ncbi:MAG TPA: DNA primase [Candidatus Paceibacterota bacterium]|nr:DNA primase [Candidatus Paceibacterota bacterium]
MSDTVQQIKDRLSIVDVVSQYVKLERAGATLRARCPFHAERTPSFTVSPERGTYHCFGCGVGGDIFSFVEAIEGLDFKGALKVLADKAGVEIVYSGGHKEEKDEKSRLFELMEVATIFYASRMDPKAKIYLIDRGMKESTIKEFRVGYAGNEWSELSDYLLKTKKFSEKEIIDSGMGKKNERGGLLDKFRNRIMFPISDSAGRVIAFSGRSFGEHASPEAPKYLNSPETPLYHKSKVLYGFDKAKVEMRKLGCAVLVEGQMDLLASHQAGWSNTVAVSGTAFTSEHAALIKRMTDNIVIALDADAAGIKAAGKASRAALASGLNVKVAQLPSGSDPADLILKDGPDTWRVAIRDSKDIITFLLDVLQAHAKSPDVFRRSVETVVLPFLQDVQSPIAREQYLHQIAKRLGVSEAAISQALAKLPETLAQNPAASETKRPESIRNMHLDRAREAFSILLWQKALTKPTLDIERYEKELREAIGEAMFDHLMLLPERERENLRFSAERLHSVDAIDPAAKSLLHVIVSEKLSRELTAASKALEIAEAQGDETEVERLMAHCRVLTTRIAQLHAAV